MKKTITLEKDIKLLFIKASTFPEGVQEAFKKLHALVPISTNRRYFGISRPENGSIEYKAAAEELTAGEAEKLNAGTMLLKKGDYICLTIENFMSDLPSIGKAFQELLLYPGLDPQGYCVEWYLGEKDVNCMIRLKDN